MLVLIRVLIIVYIIAINVYSFLLLKFQKDSYDEGECENAVHDGKENGAAIEGLWNSLGEQCGAAGIYVSMFVFRYRLRSMFLMVLMPVLIVLNLYLLFLGITADIDMYRQY